MNTIERIKMVKAMEFICRNINDENILWPWLSVGVADGDIKYGDLTASEEEAEDMEFYIRDEDFADLMDTFLYCMKRAGKSGGLYCDGIVSKDMVNA